MQLTKSSSYDETRVHVPSFFIPFGRPKDLPCGGFAEVDLSPSRPKSLETPKANRSSPISINPSVSPSISQSLSRDHTWDTLISEFSSRSQFFPLFLHALSSSGSKLSSGESCAIPDPENPIFLRQTFEKYILSYMNHWEAVYENFFVVGGKLLKREKLIINNFQKYEHDRLNADEWRICSSLIKEIKPEVADQLMEAVKELKEFETILLKYLLPQHCLLRRTTSYPPTSSNCPSPAATPTASLPSNTPSSSSSLPSGLIHQSLLDLSIRTAQCQQNTANQLRKDHLSAHNVLRYYLVSYYRNYSELWYPSEIILEAGLIAEIQKFHLRRPFPSSVVLDYWFHPSDTADFL